MMFSELQPGDILLPRSFEHSWTKMALILSTRETTHRDEPVHELSVWANESLTQWYAVEGDETHALGWEVVRP